MDLTTSTSSAPATPEVITGSCLCGGIQYEVTGEPMKRVMCHCDNCRKFTGSSFMANSFMKESVSSSFSLSLYLLLISRNI